ncbi:MAG TPA: S41 family peptidase [Dongiaceae bacterium]|nr:S41 family peptidase [Dongiaceae bacterium]
MTRGMSYIGELYVDDPDISELTLAGLQNLSMIEHGLTAQRSEPATLTLLIDGRVIKHADLDDGAEPADWGMAASQLIQAAREHSTALSGANPEDIYQAFFTGVMSKLDHYSRYHSAADTNEIRARREGFGGIGVTFTFQDGKAFVQAVRHYTPAERTGIRSGDEIVAIQGTPTEKLSQKELIDRLRGPIDSMVEITYRHPNQPPRTIVLTRALVVPETVTYHREGDIAYFRIYSFNRTTGQNLEEKLLEAYTDIGKRRLRGIILDLRGNPGGLVDQAVAAANLFLKKGTIVTTEGRHPDSHQNYEATDEDAASGKPITILVDGNSASAAEIVAAALQDNGRAVLIGTSSFGKGTVQAIEHMPNGGELDITWARYHAPSGYSLHGLGVLPNLCTSGRTSAEDILAMLRAGKIPPLPIAERNRTAPNDESGHDRLRASCPPRNEENAVDLDLAVKLLQEMALIPSALRLAATPLTSLHDSSIDKSTRLLAGSQ